MSRQAAWYPGGVALEIASGVRIGYHAGGALDAWSESARQVEQ